MIIFKIKVIVSRGEKPITTCSRATCIKKTKWKDKWLNHKSQKSSELQTTFLTVKKIFTATESENNNLGNSKRKHKLWQQEQQEGKISPLRNEAGYGLNV